MSPPPERTRDGTLTNSGTIRREFGKGPRWNRLEHGERRRQILDVARRLFSERSYADVSTEQIAEAAGIRRGLLHHYFGSKRDLFVEVVRDLLDRAAVPFDHDAIGTMEEVVERNVERWLDFVERNSAMWFAVSGAEGFGRDPELERLVAATRDATVERIIQVLRLDGATDELRAVLRSYGGLAELATREWLVHKSLSRAQTTALLSTALLALVREVVPAVEGVQ
ncbi:MAG: TetR/AcrR family transcriptional regulator [Acidimicrobiales bacterium]